jgi:hypothetical protein
MKGGGQMKEGPGLILNMFRGEYPRDYITTEFASTDNREIAFTRALINKSFRLAFHQCFEAIIMGEMDEPSHQELKVGN